MSANLNLARKWRSQNFDQIIGQELSVRILKNALFLNSFFPVYIFSGQRGCGKTTTARVFAAALNCEQLSKFQKNPKSVSLPCLECKSCIAVKNGSHPDFIEIDAASHTGVDNVRQIIESSSMLPLMGRKKIYLIDEAHMLSKAAFNAFLKILEEPPAFVLFILATTDVNKIIDTVKSRSFQLFFSSVSENYLLKHLENICNEEKIKYEIEGLKIIINACEGSVRDAINILEQVRFSTDNITKNATLNALGYLSNEQLLNIFDFLCAQQNAQNLIKFLDAINFKSYSPEHIFTNLLTIFQSAIRSKYGINKDENLNELVSRYSIKTIISVATEFCNNELLFSKTLNKHLFLELLMIRICSDNEVFDKNLIENVTLTPSVKLSLENQIKNPEQKNENKDSSQWKFFLDELKRLNDHLLTSIFTQASYIGFTNSTGEVCISLPKKFTFFKERIDESIQLWGSFLKKNFGDHATLKMEFNLINLENPEPIKNIELKSDDKKQYNFDNIKKVSVKKSDNNVDISDKDKWKMANELLTHFPGTIHEIQDVNE